MSQHNEYYKRQQGAHFQIVPPSNAFMVLHVELCVRKVAEVVLSQLTSLRERPSDPAHLVNPCRKWECLLGSFSIL